MAAPVSVADSKSRLAAAFSRAHGHRVTRVTEGVSVPDGWQAWRCDDVVTVLPALVADAPYEAYHRLLSRVVANCTGECPDCHAVASFNADPETHRAGWALLPVTVAVVHEPGCGAVFGEHEAGWFVPFASGGSGVEQ